MYNPGTYWPPVGATVLGFTNPQRSVPLSEDDDPARVAWIERHMTLAELEAQEREESQ